jgi:hypothetical protein
LISLGSWLIAINEAEFSCLASSTVISDTVYLTIFFGAFFVISSFTTNPGAFVLFAVGGVEFNVAHVLSFVVVSL